MERVLAIPELLSLICSSLWDSPAVLFSAALVNTRWSSVALDELWTEVKDVRPLFKLLAPMVSEPDVDTLDPHSTYPLTDVSYRFPHPLTPSDWDRFNKYGRRIRFLHLTSFPGPDSSQFAAIFDEIARSRTSLVVLPNLRVLSWDTYLQYAVIFMHPGVREFSFPICAPGRYDLAPFVNDITTRMPGLETVNLVPFVPVREIEDVVLSLFAEGHFKSLKKLIVPKHFMTSRITEALSRLPELRILEFRYDHDDHSSPNDVFDFAPHFQEGSAAFEKLEDLSLTVPLERVTRMYNPVSGNGSPVPVPSCSNLTILYLHSYNAEEPSTIHALLNTLSEACKNLNALSILSSIRATSPGRITYAHLSPVLTFPKLKQFEIVHHYPVDITQGEVEELAKSWPHLESLILCNEPYAFLAPAIEAPGANIMDEGPPLQEHILVPGSEAIDLDSVLTLEAFHPFARHCPNLQKLGLFVDATMIPEKPGVGDVVDYGFRFGENGETGGGTGDGFGGCGFGGEGTVTLSMGISPIDDPGPVALYLSRLVYPSPPPSQDPPHASTSFSSSHASSSITPPFSLTAPSIPLTLTAGISIDEITNDPRTSLYQLRDPLRLSFLNWSQVADFLPLLVAVRWEECARWGGREREEEMRGLRRELEDTRMRCAVLEGMLGGSSSSLDLTSNSRALYHGLGDGFRSRPRSRVVSGVSDAGSMSAPELAAGSTSSSGAAQQDAQGRSGGAMSGLRRRLSMLF